MKQDDPKYLYRRGGQETSEEAAKTVDAGRLEKEVLTFIAHKGEEGATAYECIQYFNPVSDSTINARPAALIRKGYAYYRGDTRKGGSGRNQLVVRANRRSVNKVVDVERRSSKETKVPANEQIRILKSKLKKLEDLFLYVYEKGVDTQDIEDKVEGTIALIVKRQNNVGIQK